MMADEIKSYRDLIAWQKSMNLVQLAYEQSANLPQRERFGLTAQLRRCAVSIPSNIAEGWGRGSTRDYVRFLRTARGSLFEFLTQVELCVRLNYDGNWNAISGLADDVRRLLQGLIGSLETK